MIDDLGGEARQLATDRELSLLVLVSCRPMDAHAVDEQLMRGIDWTRLIELALHHRVTGFLHRALDAADPALVPSEIGQALRSYAEVMRTQELELMTELWSLLESFNAASIPAVPFKGPLLRWQLHGRSHVGQPGDIDLLFRRQDVMRARELLESRGYEDLGRRPEQHDLTAVQRHMYERFQCEYTYGNPDDVVVEPHWEFSQRPLAIDIDYEGMLDRAMPVEFEGRGVRFLAGRDLALALCVHGAKHRWSRIAWVADFVALLRSMSREDLAAISEAARRHGCGLMWRVGVRLAADCAGVELPVGDDSGTCDDRRVASLVAAVVEGLARPEVPEPRNDRVDSFRLRLREQWLDRVRYIARTLFTPRRHHLESVRLPASLAWGYYPIKLGADFASLLIAALVLVRRDEKSGS